MSDHALHLYQVSRKYLKGFQSNCADAIYILKFAKEHNSVKSVDEVMVLVQYTLSDNALYLYQVFLKYLIGFQSYKPGEKG